MPMQAFIAHFDERCSRQLAVLAPLLSQQAGNAQLFLAGGHGERGAAVTEELLQVIELTGMARRYYGMQQVCTLSCKRLSAQLMQ